VYNVVTITAIVAACVTTAVIDTDMVCLSLRYLLVYIPTLTNHRCSLDSVCCHIDH
jgi:hypothetical protein